MRLEERIVIALLAHHRQARLEAHPLWALVAIYGHGKEQGNGDGTEGGGGRDQASGGGTEGRRQGSENAGKERGREERMEEGGRN